MGGRTVSEATRKGGADYNRDGAKYQESDGVSPSPGGEGRGEGERCSHFAIFNSLYTLAHPTRQVHFAESIALARDLPSIHEQRDRSLRNKSKSDR